MKQRDGAGPVPGGHWPGWAGRVPDWLDLAGLLAIVAASILLKLAYLVPAGPMLFFDEMLYGVGARAVAGEVPYPSGHYPFLYPLFLAPHVLLGTGYQGFFVANVASTSLLPAAGWLLARTCGARVGTPVALCVALLPIHFTFPTQVMAENLFVPMFAFATWYAVRGRFDGILASVLFGAFLAGLFLTKYLALPAVPLLAFFWLLGCRAGGASGRELATALAMAVAGATLLVGAWLVFAARSGIGIREAFGGGLSEFRDSGRITPGSLVMWSTVYAATLVLVCGTTLAKLFEQGALFLRAPLRYVADGPYARLVVLSLLLGGGYLLVCVHHSASLAMNYPEPQRVVARYFMHLTPLFVVVGVCGIAHGAGRRGGAVLAVVASALAGASIWFAWSVLYQDAVWTFSPWFAAIPLYATDIMGYRFEGVLSTTIIVGVLALLMARIPLVRWLYPVALAVILLEGSSYVGGVSQRETAFRPIHARTLAPHVLADTRAGRRVLVIAGIPRVPPGDIRQALVFWGVEPDLLDVVGGEQVSGFSPTIDRAYRITTGRNDDLELVESYQVGTRQGYIYREDPASLLGRREPAEFPDAPAAALLQAPCSGQDVAVLSWDFSSAKVGGVRIHVVGPSQVETLFAIQAPVGTQATGAWVQAGTSFRFRNAATGRLLKEVEPDPAACSR